MSKRCYVLFLIPILCACQSTNRSLDFIPYQYEENLIETFKEEKGDIYYKNDYVTPLTINTPAGVSIRTGVNEIKELNDITTGFDDNAYSLRSANLDNLNGVIEQSLLVVPVYFKDNEMANNEDLKLKKKTLIENAFFGDENTTNYQSVSSYYNRSSYGHLRIKGEVLDWYEINQTSSSAIEEGKKSPENYSDKIVKDIVDNLSDEIFNKYSNNNSGILDAIYIIYDYPYQNNKLNGEDTLFWAYTYYCKSSGKISAYSWSSFDFMGENVLKDYQVDATTYIHEVGHLFGLLDYYNKGNYSTYQPLGFMDMMDYNLGDHSPFSKYLLNWTTPYVLDMKDKSSGEIEIRDFSSTGDFILIPTSNYNKTAYDHYLLLSFFTPKNLNNLNNFPSYEYSLNDKLKGIFTYPNQYGVLLYEVDARLGYYKTGVIRNYTPVCYIDENINPGEYLINFYHHNELDKASDEPIYRLLESSGQNTFIDGNCASNNTFFKYGDTFGVNTFLELSRQFGVTFKVSRLTTKSAKISFTSIS